MADLITSKAIDSQAEEQMNERTPKRVHIRACNDKSNWLQIFPLNAVLTPKKSNSLFGRFRARCSQLHAHLSISHFSLQPYAYTLSTVADQLTSDPLQWRSFHSVRPVVALSPPQSYILLWFCCAGETLKHAWDFSRYVIFALRQRVNKRTIKVGKMCNTRNIAAANGFKPLHL